MLKGPANQAKHSMVRIRAFCIMWLEEKMSVELHGIQIFYYVNRELDFFTYFTGVKHILQSFRMHNFIGILHPKPKIFCLYFITY